MENQEDRKDQTSQATETSSETEANSSPGIILPRENWPVIGPYPEPPDFNPAFVDYQLMNIRG